LGLVVGMDKANCAAYLSTAQQCTRELHRDSTI